MLKENLVQGIVCFKKTVIIHIFLFAGISRRCIDVMNQYATERKSFKHNLQRFGQIQNFISESYSDYMASKYGFILYFLPFLFKNVIL